jgi:hypothetical protein
MPAILMKYLPHILIGLVLTVGLGKGYVMVKNHFIEAENTRILLSNERIDHERTRAELTSLQSTVALEDAHREMLTQLQETHKAEMVVLREEANDAKEVLEDRDRLQRVSAAKHELVTKLANRASGKVFDDLEDIYNN